MELLKSGHFKYSITYINSMSDGLDKATEEEEKFRMSYIQELRNKQSLFVDKLEEELRNVKQQIMKTPGRKGEQIKLEEISNEILRRSK
jgi:hypothetical protein